MVKSSNPIIAAPVGGHLAKPSLHPSYRYYQTSRNVGNNANTATAVAMKTGLLFNWLPALLPLLRQ